MTKTPTRSSGPVVVIGAGPYGLSVAAHLATSGIEHRIFGEPMHYWASAMPTGMYLKSEAFASNLSDPARTHTLRAFAEQHGHDYQDAWRPVPLDLFVSYGRWFQQSLVPHLEQSRVVRVQRDGAAFRVALDDGSDLRASAVVMASGLAPFTYFCDPLRSLPPQACLHSSAVTDPGEFRGRDVVVVGGGQAALESAALLSEHGAQVRVLVRKPKVQWNGAPPGPTGVRRLRQPRSGLGTGWPLWFYSNAATVFRRLPAPRRAEIVRTTLGPAGSWWLRERIENRVEIITGREVEAAGWDRDGVQLKVRGPHGIAHVETEQVISATGYRVDVDRLDVLDSPLRSQVVTFAGSPVLSYDFSSSVPGLHFVGVTAAASFGPALRFVYGTDYAARRLTHHLRRARRTARAA